MNGIRKCISAVILSIIILSVIPFVAFASPAIDIAAEASLAVEYKIDGMGIPGAHFSIYRVAAVDAYGKYTLAPKFSDYPVIITENTSEAWNEYALTFKLLVLADGVIADKDGVTDDNGRLVFDELETGLYLVIADKCIYDKYTVIQTPAIVSLPNMEEGASSWNYDVTVKPKTTRYENGGAGSTVSRRALKTWNDTNYERYRANEVEVTLLSDGEIYSTVKLNEESNWRYVWGNLPEYDVNGSKIEWAIIEKTRVEDYYVKVEQSGVSFVITNTYKEIVPPPDTDDTANPGDDTTNPSDTTKLNDTTKPTGTTKSNNSNNSHLPQTGQLWWPVFALIGLGAVVLVIGIVLRSRKAK